MDLWLNGVKLTNYVINTPYSDTIDEELDKMNFQIKSQSRITFNKNDRLVYQVKQPNDNNSTTLIINKIFCVFDWVETLEGDYWLYQLTLLSPTKLLENIIINGMAETRSGISESLRAQFTRVINKINKQQLYEQSTPIEITYNNNDLTPLSSYETTDFLWSGQSTAREILQDILDKADYLLIGTNFTIQNGNVLTINVSIVKREKVGKTILTSNSSIEGGGLDAIKEVVKGLTIHRDSEFNNGSIVSLTRNAICKDNVQQTYLPPRNDDMTIDEASEWHILTQEPIYSLNRVVALMPTTNIYVYFWYYNTATEQWERIQYHQGYNNPTMQLFIPIDITEYIVEKEVFDTLSLKDQKTKLYFKRGEKGIYGLYKRYKNNPLQSNTALKNIMNDIGDNIPALTMQNDNGVIDWSSFGLDFLWGRDYNQSSDWTDVNQITNISINGEKTGGKVSNLIIATGTHAFVSEENAYKECLFSVNYQPYCDSVVKIEKATPSGNTKNLSVLKNQSDRTIDAKKYYDSQTALINRLGNEEMTLDCMFDLTKTRKSDDSNLYECLWDLGDIINLQSEKWTLTKREIENYGNDLLKCRLTFSKNFNATNSAINMNRDKRLYGIPLNNYVDRYILIKKPSNKDYKKLAVYSYDDFTANQTDQTSDSQTGYTILDFIKIGNDSQIDRVARCKDNYAVDIERTKYSSTIVNINLRYCGTDGYSDTIWLRFLTDDDYNQINITDYSRLPFIEGSMSVGDNLSLTIYKDKMERLIFILI